MIADFVWYALIAGTAIGLVAGLVGYFLVLRGQVFSADALGHAAFAGALAALVLGLNAQIGLVAVTVLAALLLARLGNKGRPDDVAIGGLFAWILGLGALLLSLYTSTRSAENGTRGVAALFGSIFGLSYHNVVVVVLVSVVVAVVLLAIARPLLFASLDEQVATARGVRVPALGLIFLVLVALTTAEATQAVGALLVLGLFAAPAGAAQRLTSRPFWGLALSAALAVAAVWLGLGLSLVWSSVPPSFAIMLVASIFYVLAIVVAPRRIS